MRVNVWVGGYGRGQVKRGNEYNLRYDDGEDEFRVSHKLLKAVVASPTDAGSEEQKKPVATDVRKTAASEGSPVLSSSDGGGDADESAADDDNANDDDGWEIVGATGSKAKGGASRAATSAGSVGGVVVGTDGLTKRQRESRRKKERQREVKELARAQAQENGLHVRWGGTYSKMKYVPPPPPQ